MKRRGPKSISFRSLVLSLLGWAITSPAHAFVLVTAEEAARCNTDMDSSSDVKGRRTDRELHIQVQ